MNLGSNKAIDVYGNKAKNYGNVDQYTSNDSLGQKWVVMQDSMGYKIISALNQHFVLDLSNGTVKMVETFKSINRMIL